MSNSRRSRVIIDTDPGVDDITAILLALASPEIEILAFIITFGNTDVDYAYENIRKLYHVLDVYFSKNPEHKARFPGLTFASGSDDDTSRGPPYLARGEERPLRGDMYTAQYFHGRDGLSGISSTHPEFSPPIPSSTSSSGENTLPYRPTSIHGPQLTLDLLRSHPEGSITYIALGPLTSLAKACELDGELVRTKLGRVLCMGGALDVPGNTTPVAEFNFFADPYAVHDLLITPISDDSISAEPPNTPFPLDKFLLFSLDITTPHLMPFDTYQRLIDPQFDDRPGSTGGAEKDWLVHFTSSFLGRIRDLMKQYGLKDGMQLHDILPVWFAIEHPWPQAQPTTTSPSSNPPFAEARLGTGWGITGRKFEIERTGTLTRGMLVIDRRSSVEADPGALNDLTSSSAMSSYDKEYGSGRNRAQVQQQIQKQHQETQQQQQHHPRMHADEMPAPAVDSQDAAQKLTKHGFKKEEESGVGGGVLCVTSTPGERALLRLMFERIWGVDVSGVPELQ